MRILYTLLWYLLMPGLFCRLWWRGRQTPAYRRRWRERLGRYDGGGAERCVWVHAVSVGETVAAAPLIEELLARHPDLPLLVTTTTPTGSQRVQDLFGDRVLHVYAPWDFPGAVARLLRHFNPVLLLLLETELWPNMVRGAARHGVPVMLVNGRLSERSHRGYARIRGLMRPMLKTMQCLAVQSDADAARFIDLGADADRVRVTGSVKFDIDLDADTRQAAVRLRNQLGRRPVWIAASTHRGEDEQVLAAHLQVRTVLSDALLILVPRHPERFDEVARLAATAGAARRGRGELPAGDTAVWLGDTMGELMLLYGCAEVAFVGGSLVPTGGHNPLEPARWALPLLSGPHVFNFAAITTLLADAGGLREVNDAEELSREVVALLQNPSARERAGRAALGVLAAHRGALQRVVALVSSELAG